MEKNDRFKSAINYLRMRGIITMDKDVAARMGADASNVSRSLKGVPTDRFLRRFNEAFDGIFNLEWLINGAGEMLVNDVHPVPMEQGAEPYITNSHGVRYMKREDGKIIIEVPIVPYYALASPDDEFLPERFGSDTTTFEVDKIGRGKYYAFEVDGDSMDDGTRDSFQRGDIVLVRELDKDDWMPHLHISCWRFWVVCWGNNVRLKEIVRQEGAVITLHSLNPSPEYCDFSLDLSQVSRLFNVIKHKPKERSFI